MAPDPAALLRELEVTAARGRDLLAELAGIRVDATDDDGSVAATADGFGRLVDLCIGDAALRYPQRLGTRVTSAVRRVRDAAAAAAEKHRSANYPELPSLAAVESAMSSAPERAGPPTADEAGSPRVRAAVADGMEVRSRVERARRDFADRRIRQAIGAGLGAVTIDGTATRLRIEIAAAAARRAGPRRLGDQVVAALRRAEERAEEYRTSTLAALDLGGTTMGNLVRDAQRVLDMATAERERGSR